MPTVARTPTILLIEHNPQTQLALHRAMQEAGYRVLVAQKWQTGLSMAQDARPDLIVLDQELPGLGGEALAVRLRAAPQLAKTPLIALAEASRPAYLLGAGCAALVAKPPDPRELLEQVARVLNGESGPSPAEDALANAAALSRHLVDRLEARTRELDEMERRLQEANRVRDNFLTVASRELRTPLTLLTGYVTLLQSTVAQLDVETPLSLTEMTNGLVQGTRRLSDIVQELLKVSRIVTGDLSLAIGPTRISSLVNATLTELDGPQRQRVEVANLDSLPIIQADGTQIRLALRNMLGYLLGAMAADDRIRIAGEHRADIVILSINGRGLRVDPGEQETLFERVYPTQTNSKAETGLGFGLAITKGIVQAHGGRLWVESSGTNSSTFYILLPIEHV